MFRAWYRMSYSKTGAPSRKDFKVYLEKHGFSRLEIGQNISQLEPGNRVYYVNRAKNVAAFIIGQKSLTESIVETSNCTGVL